MASAPFTAMNRRVSDRPASYGRFNLLNPRNMTALAHFSFGAVCLLRPNLGELFRSYAPFGNLIAWGVGMLLLGLILLLAQRGSVLLMLGHLLSALCLWTIAGLLTVGAGLLPASTFAFGLGVSSMLLFRKTFGDFLDGWVRYQDLKQHPPAFVERQRWFQRLKERAQAGGVASSSGQAPYGCRSVQDRTSVHDEGGGG